jgi:hypothetical protein
MIKPESAPSTQGPAPCRVGEQFARQRLLAWFEPCGPRSEIAKAGERKATGLYRQACAAMHSTKAWTAALGLTGSPELARVPHGAGRFLPYGGDAA